MLIPWIKRRMILPCITALSFTLTWGQVLIAKSNSPIESRLLVTLLTHPMMDILNRENAIHELCPESLGKAKAKECKDKQLSREEWTMDLYVNASSKSKRLGRLVFTITPGHNVEAAFKPIEGKEVTFIPDEYDSDWGYGPYYNHTVLQKEGTWIQLPKNPFPQPVWLDLSAPRGKGLGLAPKDVDNALRSPLSLETIYTLKQAVPVSTMGKKSKDLVSGGLAIIILDIKGQTVRFREETPSDMACGEDVPPEKIKPVEYTAELKSFYDSDEHVIVHTKYTRGC